MSQGALPPGVKSSESLQSRCLGASITASGGLFMAVANVPVKQGHAVLLILWIEIAASQLWLLVESMITSLRMGDRAILRESAWHIAREITWQDVVEVRYKSLGGLFVITHSQGTRNKIPTLMEGLGSFVREVQSRLPATVYRNAPGGSLEVELGPPEFRRSRVPARADVLAEKSHGSRIEEGTRAYGPDPCSICP